jgi:hypothetical protein
MPGTPHPKVPFTARRTPRTIALITGITLVAAAILWSPMLLYLTIGANLPWPALSDVGQAYGGASALLSGAALCGVGASLILQSRQMRQELINLDRQRHFDLVKLALDNPEFFEVMDPGVITTHQDRQIVFANLTMNYWLALWELGEIAESELRKLTSTMFRHRGALEWWRQQRQVEWITVRTRRRRRFLLVVNEEWMKSAEAPAPKVEPKRTGSATTWAVALLVVAAAVAARAVSRGQSRSSDPAPRSWHRR